MNSNRRLNGGAAPLRFAPRSRGIALAVAVGTVLADGSIVVLALPDIYRELDVSVTAVTWVLVAFNLVLALAAVPAAMLARRVGRGSGRRSPGLVVFGAASLACGLADSIGLLLAGALRAGVGGAAAVCASLELLPSVAGSERRAAAVWAAAGRARRRDRPRRRRPAHRARLLAVDLPAAGADRDRSAPPPSLGAARAESAPRRFAAERRAGRAPAPRGERGARARLGGAGRGALPRRPAADRGLAPDADRRRRRGHRDADQRARRRAARRARAGGRRRAPPQA